MAKFPDDPEVKAEMEKLKEITKNAFNAEDPTLPHFKMENKPEGLDQDKYFLIYRK